MRRLELWKTLVLAVGFASVGVSQESRDLVLEGKAQRIALIIGNENYSSAEIRTARNDAKAVSASLRTLGYRVEEHFNTKLKDLEKAIDATISSVHRGDIVVVYYAGICLGIGSENYLTPVDFVPKDSADAKYTTYSVGRLMDRIEAAGAATAILFLDASYKNPFALGPPVKDLPVAMSGGSGSHIIMAAAPGTASIDIADSRNSLFGGFLSDVLMISSGGLGDLFKRVQEKVYSASGGTQTPVISSGGDTRVMIRSAPAAATETAVIPFESELKDWKQLQSSNSEGDIREFISRYPQGRFQEAASLRLSAGAAPREGLIGSTAPNTTVTSNAKIEKMARVTKPEVDPNFDFVAADLELLAQAEALEKRLERDGLIESDAATNAYLNQVGLSILPGGPPPFRVTWRFGVIRNPIPNAFALPNGSVYVNSGMLAILENESQLAGVLAHEITHVTGRHGYYANRDYRKKQTAMSIVQMAANYAPVGSDLTSSVIRGATYAAALLVPAILNASILGYARDLERNADLYAIDKLLDTGYDPREMIGAFRHLQEKHEVQLVAAYYNDHPKLEDRIRYVETAITGKGIPESPLYAVQAKQYRDASRKVRLFNVKTTLLAGQRRTALVLAKRMAEAEPESPDTLVALADTYRGLGPWTPEASEVELTDKAKKDAMKAKLKLTPQEEEARIMQTAGGQAAWKENAKNAEDLYRRALQLNPEQVEIHRSLGQLYEKSGDIAGARESYTTFLTAAPDHPDATRIKRKLDGLRDGLSTRK